MNSTLLITPVLTDQRARKAVFTCVVYTNNNKWKNLWLLYFQRAAILDFMTRYGSVLLFGNFQTIAGTLVFTKRQSLCLSHLDALKTNQPYMCGEGFLFSDNPVMD